MDDFYQSFKKILDRFAIEVASVDPDNLPAIGALMNTMDDLIGQANENNKSDYALLLKGLKSVAGSIVWGEQGFNISQIQDGASLLQDIVEDDEKGIDTKGQTQAFLDSCGIKPDEEPRPLPGKKIENAKKSDQEKKDAVPTEAAKPDPTPTPTPSDSPPKPSMPPIQDLIQDRELVENFIMEALENFRDIEVSIVELEQDPTNIELINDIFRPFHTIKGVSGFLNLTDINRLTHHVETVLDEARDQKLTMDENIIDIVLAAIDLTKSMINHLDESLKAGEVQPRDFKIDAFLVRLDNVSKGSPDDSNNDEDDNHEPSPADIIPLDDDKDIADEPEAVQSPGIQVNKKMTMGPAFIKVDTLKLDNMIDMVGELVINQAMLMQEISGTVSAENRKIHSSITQLSRITSEIQRISMSMRMIPIKQTFQKMVRLVRDLAKKSGKKIGLKMMGEETEIDRNMVDEIYDPLVHLVRNSCDHGLELTDERRKMGKSDKGMVMLNAYHKGGNIVIEIKDDGKGLNRDKIVKKALEKGLIKANENLTDQEVFTLIFQPGFSTADKITDVSGRGVGMDVVKRVIDNMRGKLEIHSEINKGTTIWMKLPLTLAIIDGIIVRAGERDYIMPTASVVESLRPDKESYKHVVKKGEMIQIRDSLHPLIRLHEIFGFEPKYYNPWEAIVMVAESDGRNKCILVDEIVGKQEVVIKNLGGLKKVKGMAGGAILADGRVGLILDVASLFEISEA